MDNTPTVWYVQVGVGILDIDYRLCKFVAVREGIVYGSRYTTEYGGLFLVTF